MPPRIPYARDGLFRPGRPMVYEGRALDQIAFPLGGIGTGAISLSGWGDLRDFEIFNRPAKGLTFPNTFFAVRIEREGYPPLARVVRGPVGGDNFTGIGHGVAIGGFVGRRHGVAIGPSSGFPGFRRCRFVGAFPFGRVEVSDPKVPLRATLEAFNPFIPLNADDSSIPVAVLLFTFENTSDVRLSGQLWASLDNMVGYPDLGGGATRPLETDGAVGLYMTTQKHAPGSPRFGSLALATDRTDALIRTRLEPVFRRDNRPCYWDRLAGEGFEASEESVVREEGVDTGAMALPFDLMPGESARLPVWIAWHNPVFEKYWEKSGAACCGAGGDGGKPTWPNYYASLFADAADVAGYVGRHLERLERETRRFADALFASTLPEAALDAVSSQISILKSTTCLRLEDGTFYGFEGCHPGEGCCVGSCTHVWNYAQALPFLFPSLERSMREADYANNFTDDGAMAFRMGLPLGSPPANLKMPPAADGQMGGVVKVYREWLIGGDDEWLRRLWPDVRKALEYAWKQWDADKDGVMEGVQHNTYDVEFHGPNTMMGTFYLAALRAGEEMARRLGEADKADEYRSVFESGRAKMDDELFNGEYYVQKIQRGFEGVSGPVDRLDPVLPDAPPYQIGEGCLSDQVIGQWLARIVGLGDLLDRDNVRSALQAVFRHNWKADMSEHVCGLRVYALNDEAALTIASWPRGGRPGLPCIYGDEAGWGGIEYQVASHLIYEGFLEEGLAIVKGARDRYNGVRRNPWNEIECGSHYARSLSSWSLLTALSGFEYSAPARRLAFCPRVFADDFSAFFCVEAGWGMLRQSRGRGHRRAVVEVHVGGLTLERLGVGFDAADGQVALGGRALPARIEAREDGSEVRLDEPVVVPAGAALTVDAWG